MGENMLGGGGMSPADVRAVMGNGDNWGGNGAWWVVILFALIYGGNGFGWGNRGGYQPQYATQDFVQNGFNFNDLQDQNRDLMQAITGGTAQTVAAANQVFHDMYTVVSDKYGELQRDIAGLAVGQANAGVVRYPDTFAYNAGNNPFCGCGNNYAGCCNI